MLPTSRILPLADLNSALSGLIFSIIQIATLLLLAYVILDLARYFIPSLPEAARQFHNALGRLWEPVLGPIRNALPPLGGIDFSPLIVLLALQFIGQLVA
ncbi:MAG: YggT family protein [Solirubrobacteraceae bacterium]|nr:YggT family protein [Solirubrobacteraceae bacterium]